MPDLSHAKVNEENRWDDWLERGWMECLDETPFLTACREGNVTREALMKFVAQQYFYSRHFTRYLCALLSNIEDDSDRRELTENLLDETGLGKEKGVPHSVLYRQMLEKLGVDPSRHEMLPQTRELIDVMSESCRNPNSAVGLGALCLGAEAIVPHVYTQIVQGFQSRGVPKEMLEFFLLHIGCDDEHAITMRNIIERQLVTKDQKSALRCSAARAIAARTRFFEAIQPVQGGKLAHL